MKKYTKLFEDSFYDNALKTFMFVFIVSALKAYENSDKNLLYSQLTLCKELKESLRHAVIPDDFKLTFLDVIKIHEQILHHEYSECLDKEGNNGSLK